MGDRGRVLVADDTAVNRKIATAMLNKLGHDFDVVENGAQAVDAVTRIAYYAVLMDCHMPGMDGYEATRRIRRSEQQEGHLPIIAMSGGTSAQDREEALASGMDDYLVKPLDLDALDQALRRCHTSS